MNCPKCGEKLITAIKPEVEFCDHEGNLAVVDIELTWCKKCGHAEQSNVMSEEIGKVY